MIRMVNQLRYYSNQHKLSLVGLCLILISVLLYLLGHSYRENQLLVVKDDVAQARNAKVMTNPQVKLVDTTLDFPNQSELPDILEFVYSEAKVNHIDFGSVSYQYLELKPIHAIGYELVMPIFGKYLDIKTFLNKITQSRNDILLSGIELNRGDDQSNDVDGSLQITIYLKE